MDYFIEFLFNHIGLIFECDICCKQWQYMVLEAQAQVLQKVPSTWFRFSTGHNHLDYWELFAWLASVGTTPKHSNQAGVELGCLSQFFMWRL